MKKIKLPRDLDRRIKLSDAQREEIKAKYATGLYSQRALAREYGVDKKLIKFILCPEEYKKSKQQLKERRADGRYKPSKEQRNATIREHRRYKQKLYLEGKLVDNNQGN